METKTDLKKMLDSIYSGPEGVCPENVAPMFVEAMESQRSAEECERYGGLDGMSDYYVGVTSGLVRALGWFTEWTVRNWDDLLFFIVSGSNDDTIREWGYGFLLDEDKED